ncbi:uncharacterized protein G2W53_027335 [Senna tora]|uniref:Uncharacterized protein n=1 Tax=Senna tora TaxID=362788 RepID=A0A834THG9_9FABA|nr:uncharacterized protein G2W53_027335 [Senna tora]
MNTDPPEIVVFRLQNQLLLGFLHHLIVLSCHSCSTGHSYFFVILIYPDHGSHWSHVPLIYLSSSSTPLLALSFLIYIFLVLAPGFFFKNGTGDIIKDSLIRSVYKFLFKNVLV